MYACCMRLQGEYQSSWKAEGDRMGGEIREVEGREGSKRIQRGKKEGEGFQEVKGKEGKGGKGREGNGGNFENRKEWRRRGREGLEGDKK